MSKSKKLISKVLALGVLWLIVLTVWTTGISPILDNINQSHDKITRLEKRIIRQEVLVSEAPMMETKLLALREIGVDNFYRFDTGTEALASMQRDVLSLIRAAGLRVKSTQSRAVNTNGDQTKISFQLNLSGQIKNLSQFLQRVENKRPLISLENIVIRSPRNQPEGRAHLVDISLSASSYFIGGNVDE